MANTFQFNAATNQWEVKPEIVASLTPTFQSVTITDPVNGLIIASTTKEFKITISDTGALSQTEIIAAP